MKSTVSKFACMLASLLAAQTTVFALGTEHLGQFLAYPSQTVQMNYLGGDFSSSINLGGGGTHIAGTLNFTVAYDADPFSQVMPQVVTSPVLPLFCVDLAQYASSGLFTVIDAGPENQSVFPLSPLAPLSAAQVNALEVLYGTAFGSAYNYFNTINGWSTNKKAGFQLAVWEIAFDSALNYNLNQGYVNTSSTHAAVGFANTFLGNVDQALANGGAPFVNLSVFTSPSKQDILIPWDEPWEAPPPVPEPSTYAAAGALSMLGLAALRRRKSQKK